MAAQSCFQAKHYTYRKADLVFDCDPHYSSSSITYPILTENLTFICRKDHPRLDNSLNKEQAALEQFSIMESDGPAIKLAQQNINDNIGERTFCFRSSSLFSILSVVENSDTVAIIPIWLFEKVKNAFNIKSLSTEFSLLPVNIYMVHNKTSLQNKALGKIVAKIKNHFSA
ncbi:DNA-binding transcriptional LysR family regulator [Ewingella americana]